MVVLKVNGDTTKTQDVTLPGGASKDVTFVLNIAEEGDYMITIDRLTRKLVVLSLVELI